MMKRIGLAGILVLVVMGILSIFGSAGADGNPEVTLNAPSLYIMKTNPQEGDGYTFTVNLPEGMENDSVEDWSLSVSSNRVTI